MKLYGLGGVGTGKLGNQVFAVKSGVQIVRQYQPVVANPNTAAQVETRAKMKLASQVAAVVSPAIAIAPEGNKTKRNLFISRNYSNIGYEDSTASIALTKMQLTKGTLAFVGLNASKTQAGKISASLRESAPQDITKVAYCVVRQSAEGNLSFVESKVIDRDTNGTFVFESDAQAYDSNRYSVLAYGIRVNSEKAALKLGMLAAPTAEDIAKIVATRALNDTDLTLTQTVGASFTAEGGSTEPEQGGPVNP